MVIYFLFYSYNRGAKIQPWPMLEIIFMCQFESKGRLWIAATSEFWCSSKNRADITLYLRARGKLPENKGNTCVSHWHRSLLSQAGGRDWFQCRCNRLLRIQANKHTYSTMCNRSITSQRQTPINKSALYNS